MQERAQRLGNRFPQTGSDYVTKDTAGTCEACLESSAMREWSKIQEPVRVMTAESVFLAMITLAGLAYVALQMGWPAVLGG